MRVNGKVEGLEEPLSLQQYLEGKSYNLSRIAVERNGEIVCKEQYYEVILNQEDEIEIVSFVGGG